MPRPADIPFPSAAPARSLNHPSTLPADDPLSRAAAIHARITSLSRWRRAGVTLMYSPAFVVCLTAGVAFSVVPWAVTTTPSGNTVILPWARTILGTLGAAIFFSVPLALVGVVLRLVAAILIDSFARAHTLASLPPLPPPRRRELLGRWRVEELSERGLRLRRWLAPPLLWWPVIWGVTSTLLFILHGVALLAIGGALFAAMIMLGLLLLWFAVVVAVGTNRGFTLRPDGNGRALLEVWSRLHPLLPKRVDTYGIFTPAPFSAQASTLELTESNGATVNLAAFEPGPLGAWEARRMAAAMNALATHLGSSRHD